MKRLIILLAMMAGLAGSAGAQQTTDDAARKNSFVKGADVGFLTGQERRGVKFHDRTGRERECLELLKNDYEMSAIRMRVWVNPRDGNCDKNELLAMAKRVKALGMDLMVDFHYSDSWADPSQQTIPAAWQGHSYKQMKRDVQEHTVDVLTLLRQNGITPRWVQVGNETANGLLWPMGHIQKHPKHYAGFIGAAYDAVKKVFPETTVIIHLDRGHKQSLYDWNLDIVKKYGGKWDMIGMSLYPYWARRDHPELQADSIVTDCMRNIRHVSRKYGCDVMIVETGFEVDEQHPEVMDEGRRLLTRVIREAQTETEGHCRGVFYWEPQCLPGHYKLGAFNSKAAPTAIMEGFVERPSKSIVILYENDVHCGIDGYTKIAGLRDAINRADTAYAAAVCVGDFLQGNTTGAISKGQYIADILRLMDYHALTLGNHEFDYGVPRMKQLLDGHPVTCANLYEAGEPQPVFAPYIIRQYGDKRVAYVGACTPETMILEGYSFYDTNGVLLYDLKPKTFYQLIQQAVDAARAEGADYVVLLSHVGETPQSMGFSSHRLVNNTRGIDVVLDGHSHEIIECAKAVNLDGKEITVTQTGTQFVNVGKLLITPDGRMTTQLIKRADIPYENERISAVTDSIRQMVKAVTSAKVAHSDYRLVVSDENAQWIVRGQETNAGDLVADAYRHAMKADIGMENGGGIRNDIMAGDITYGDIIGMLPYDNTLRRISVTARQLKEMLTRCTALVPVLDGNFPQCSGLRFTIHSKSHTVSDIQIQQANGSYAPIDMKRTYSVALTNYNHEGGGFFDCFKKCPVLEESSLRYYEALADYLGKVLGGSTGKTYAKPQGRITIVKD